MKFKMNKVELLTLLQKALPFAERKTTIPILSTFLFDAAGDTLTVKATDLDNSLTVSTTANIIEEGRCAIPAHGLIKVLKNLKTVEATDVTLSLIAPKDAKNKEVWVRLQCGELNVKLAGTAAVNYPSLRSFPEAVTRFAVTGDVLRGLIERTTYAIAQQGSRYTLNAALFVAKPDSVLMVTTDGHRLATAKRLGTYEVNKECRFLIGSKALLLLNALVDGATPVEITTDETTIFMRCGNWTMTSRKVTGQYPNYEAVLPKHNEKEVVFVSAKLKEVLTRVAQFSDERSRAVRFNLEPNKGLTISASSTELGEASERITVPYTGDAVTIGFNADYITDILGTLEKTDTIAMKLRDNTSAALFVPVDCALYESQNVVMPMRI